MARVFSAVLNMSLTACFVILAVLAVRFLLRKAPRKFSYVLWAVVLFRLLCPVALESPLSLLPTARPLAAVEQAVRTQTPAHESGTSPIRANQTGANPTGANPAGTNSTGAVQTGTSPTGTNPTGANSVSAPNVPVLTVPDGTQATPSPAPAQTADPVTIAAAVWLCGAFAIALYSALSLLRLRRRLVGAVPEGDGVWIADHISTPFVLGLVRPRIYLPSSLPEAERDYILLHERTHIRRFDHIVKALAFAALTVHWFNPLVWLAFRLAGRDMEMSCDEAVLRKMDRDVRADYSSSLLRLSAGKRLPAGPLAFGDGDPQSRIKNVMNYKKPALWVVVLALAAVLAACTALSTDPAGNPGSTPDPVDLSGLSAELEFSPNDEDQCIRIWGDIAGQSMGTDSYPGDRIHWYPAGTDYPLGRIHMGYAPFDGGIRGSVTAAWTDETRTAVTLSTFSMAVVSNWSNTHWWEFTVELSGTGGTVTEMNDRGPVVSPSGANARYYPESISDEQAVELARICAKLLTAAEDYYNNSGLDWSQDPEQDSSDQSKAQWDEVLAPYAPFGLTWEFDDPDLDGNGLTMWFDGKVVRGIMDYEAQTWITEHIGDGFPEGAVELIAVYTDGKLSGLRPATAEEQSQFDLERQANAAWGERTERTEFTGKLTFTYAEGSPSGGSLPYLIIGGLDAEQVWFVPESERFSPVGDQSNQLHFTAPAFLGSRFRNATMACVWTDDTRAALLIGLMLDGNLDAGEDLPYANFIVELDSGAVTVQDYRNGTLEEALPFTDGELADMARTLAQIMTEAERYWYDGDGGSSGSGDPICAYPLAPVDSLPFAEPLKMEFCSGAGGWRTYLTLNPDGSFTGDYSDSDMGSGGDGYQSTRYVCQFHGRFGDFVQLTNNSWSLTLKELVIDTGHPVGEVWIVRENGYNIGLVSSDPYGFDSKDGGPLEPGAQFTLYAPTARGWASGDELYGMSGDNTDYDSIMYGFWTWWPDKREWTPNSTLGSWGLCNMETGQGFFTTGDTPPYTNLGVRTFSWEEERALYTGQPGVKESGFVHTEPYETDSLPTVEYVAQEVTVDYDRVAQYYDPEAHINKFVFYKLDAAGGDQTVYMTNYGETKLIVYGE